MTRNPRFFLQDLRPLTHRCGAIAVGHASCLKFENRRVQRARDGPRKPAAHELLDEVQAPPFALPAPVQLDVLLCVHAHELGGPHAHVRQSASW